MSNCPRVLVHKLSCHCLHLGAVEGGVVVIVPPGDDAVLQAMLASPLELGERPGDLVC